MVKVERRHQMEVREGRSGRPSTHPTINLTGGQQAHWKTAYVRALCKLSQDFIDQVSTAFTGSESKNVRQLGQLVTRSLVALQRRGVYDQATAAELALALRQGGGRGVYASARILDEFGYHFGVPVMRQLARGLNTIPPEPSDVIGGAEGVRVREDLRIRPGDHPFDPARAHGKRQVATDPRMLQHHQAMDVLHLVDVVTDVFSRALPTPLRLPAVYGPMVGRAPLDMHMRLRPYQEDISGLEPLIHLAEVESRLAETAYNDPNREALESQRNALTAALPSQLDQSHIAEAAKANRRYQMLDNASYTTTAMINPNLPLFEHGIQGGIAALFQPTQVQGIQEGAQPDRLVVGGEGTGIPEALVGQPLTEDVLQQLQQMGVTEVATTPASTWHNVTERFSHLADPTEVSRAVYRTQGWVAAQGAGLKTLSKARDLSSQLASRIASRAPGATSRTAAAVQRVGAATRRVAQVGRKLGNTRMVQLAARASSAVADTGRAVGRAVGRAGRTGRAVERAGRTGRAVERTGRTGRAVRGAIDATGRGLRATGRVVDRGARAIGRAARSPWVLPAAAAWEGIQGYRYATGRDPEEVARTDRVRYQLWAQEFAELKASGFRPDQSVLGAIGGTGLNVARGFFLDPAHIRARMHDSAVTHWLARRGGWDAELRQEKDEFFAELARVDEDLAYLTVFDRYHQVMPQMFPALADMEEGHLIANHIAAQAAHRLVERQRGNLDPARDMDRMEDGIVYGILGDPAQQRTMRNLLELVGTDAFLEQFVDVGPDGHPRISPEALTLASRPGAHARAFFDGELTAQELTSPYEQERQEQAQAEADAEPDDPRSEREIREEAWSSAMEALGEEHLERLRRAHQEWAQEQQRRADEMREHRQRLRQREEHHAAQIRSMYEKALSQQADRWARQDEAHAAQMASTRSRFDDLMARSAPTPPVDSVPPPGQTMPETPSMARPTFDMRSTLQDLKHKGVIHG